MRRIAPGPWARVCSAPPSSQMLNGEAGRVPEGDAMRGAVMAGRGRVYRRCGCVDRVTGRQLGQRCPRLAGGRHGSWYVRLDLPAGSDGRCRRVRRGGYSSRRAAAAVLAALRGPGPACPGRVVTTGEWLEHWLASRTSPAASTVRSYAGHVRLYLVPYLGRVPLAELSAAHVQAMFTAITRHHQALGSQVSAATLSRIRATLRAAVNTAIRSGLICDNPASQAELPPARRPRAVVWTPARIEHWQRTGERPAVAGVDRRPDRALPPVHQGPPAVCRLSPHRAAGAAPWRGGGAALV